MKLQHPFVIGLSCLVITLFVIFIVFVFSIPFDYNSQSNSVPCVETKAMKPSLHKRDKMDKIAFWHIIDYSSQNWNRNSETTASLIKRELRPYSQQDIARFAVMADTYVESIENNKAIQSACQVVNGTSSQEDVHNFSQWIVMQGQYVYDQIARHPDSLAILNICTEYKYFSTELLNTAPTVYEEKFGERYDDVLKYIKDKEGNKIKQDIKQDLKLYDDSKLTNKYPASIQQIPEVLPMLSSMYGYDPTKVIEKIDAIKKLGQQNN